MDICATAVGTQPLSLPWTAGKYEVNKSGQLQPPRAWAWAPLLPGVVRAGAGPRPGFTSCPLALALQCLRVGLNAVHTVVLCRQWHGTGPQCRTQGGLRRGCVVAEPRDWRGRTFLPWGSPASVEHRLFPSRWLVSLGLASWAKRGQSI